MSFTNMSMSVMIYIYKNYDMKENLLHYLEYKRLHVQRKQILKILCYLTHFLYIVFISIVANGKFTMLSGLCVCNKPLIKL